MIAGIILIFSGIMVAVYPPLLSLVVAVLLISSGIAVIFAGLKYRNMAKRSQSTFVDILFKT
ncbi:MAG: hypothetical protein P9L90_04845 [Candidatus Aadella gelida]|nr:hypothetical protein [Candidatus Aadella gelida]